MAITLHWLVGTAILATCGAHSAGATQTVITTYAYNADGALTATTTQTDGQPAVTTYNTYDNFTPSGADPTLGTVRAADGNLVAIGASPGAAQSASFQYDQRDRLTSCSAAGQPAVAYAYHPNSLLAVSTLAGGDVLQTYYGATPVVANMRQPSTGMASSFLGPMRYVSDGTEQALLRPRKDIAGVYTPAAPALVPYSYEPYGAPRGAPPAGGVSGAPSWDLSQNPFQYAGEYRDGVCGAYYLRARWYLPGQQSFLSRDPVDATHHYGYTGGNPIGRVDPSGLRFTYANYQGDVNSFLKHLSFGTTVLSILPVTGEAMFLLQASAAGEFWHSAQASVTFGLAALAIGVEGGRDVSGPLLNVDRRLGYRAAFGGRIGADLAIGGAQSAVAATGPHWRFEPQAFGENIAVAFGTMGAARFGAGLGFRPFSLTVDDVDARTAEHFANQANGETALVFRAKSRAAVAGMRSDWTTPWMEWRHLGLYHEALIGVDADTLNLAEIRGATIKNADQSAYAMARVHQFSLYENGSPGARLNSRHSYQYVGAFPRDDVDTAFRTDPLGIPSVTDHQAHLITKGTVKPGQYDPFRRNCQDHAAGILRMIQNPSAPQ